MTAAFNAILADDRPINVRPWLYRIARNRSLNHLRRVQAIGVDSMDHHLAEHGASTADKVHEREEFRLLVGDIQELPETQKTALVLREMDALSYDQIAEAMETTVPSVKSLLVRARVSLAEAAEARLLSCDEVRIELAEVAEGLLRKPSPLVRRHLRDCKRCAVFKTQLKQTNKALAALLPIGPLVFLRKLAFVHLGHSAGSGATAAAGSGAGARRGASAAGAGAAGAAVAGAGAFGSSSGLVSAGHRRARRQGRRRTRGRGTRHRRRGRGRPSLRAPARRAIRPRCRVGRRRRPLHAGRAGGVRPRPRSSPVRRSTSRTTRSSTSRGKKAAKPTATTPRRRPRRRATTSTTPTTTTATTPATETPGPHPDPAGPDRAAADDHHARRPDDDRRRRPRR